MRGALNSVYTSISAAPKASTLSAPPAGQTWKSYYYAGNQLIALRVEGDPVPSKNGVYYLHTDHLGSTSLTTCGNTGGCAGTPLGGEMPGTRQNYYPFGQIRTQGTNLLTDKGFTGQRLDDTGLMHYGARYYSPVIGRFVSADTIVPGAGNPQAFNRYTYGLNNPVKYTDPTGHKACDEQWGCNGEGRQSSQPPPPPPLESQDEYSWQHDYFPEPFHWIKDPVEMLFHPWHGFSYKKALTDLESARLYVAIWRRLMREGLYDEKALGKSFEEIVREASIGHINNPLSEHELIERDLTVPTLLGRVGWDLNCAPKAGHKNGVA